MTNIYFCHYPSFIAQSLDRDYFFLLNTTAERAGI